MRQNLRNIPNPSWWPGATAAVALVYGLSWATQGWAQTDSDRIAELERLVKQLTERVKAVDQMKVAEPAPSTTAAPVVEAADAPTATQESRIDALELTFKQMDESSSSNRASLGVPLHGFMDVGYAHSRQTTTDDRRGGFALGNLDFYLTPEFGPRVKSLIEVVFEWDHHGGLLTDLERLQIGYTFADTLTLWAGRFHSPYGYWNTAFHHGAQFQTAITRPRFLEFEDKGGILPAHAVGLWGTGKRAAGPGKVVYDVYVINGNRVTDGELDFQAVLDDNSNKGLGSRVGYAFSGALSGLTLGVHGVSQSVKIYTGGMLTGQSDLRMLGGYAVYDTDDWEAIAEYYNYHDRDLTGSSGTRTSWAAFAQVGRHFDAGFTPYARYEKASLDQSDPYFQNLISGASYNRGVIGLRYDLDTRAALKLEGNRTHDARLAESFEEVHIQFAVRF